ncbi:TPA: restriction endonuclease subunit S [Vibrio parahaemolyticus]|uniref:restriction endonuclease subunit S n=1 Tax=Vibrio parahaemolyticus TaxID=670 RepID=UPI0009443F74|nr:restriction endonuclease subunit S [Vibrio parahaemolyticus]EHU4943684.1 restriction endonuclease subunit S [Vibrio vulnificus]MDG2677334.1 restriction endonuclease subunit S [Vibrio parahaemolyticus]OKY32761.1 restriction endonuclease [Vibrio parahaemolyticus]HCG8428234.1 restriction endonuclease subunit S [Vibrio parahaemolyticus]HCH1720816.1 restriction endonuclease subunit S [Vibrio parahaemolyticus]
MAVENLITEHIDIWTSAVTTKSTSGRGSSKKLELYGIKKLRELILELAVRGKLVPQHPGEPPVTTLLDKMEQERIRLIELGKLKKQKMQPPLKQDTHPYNLPVTWSWMRLSDVAFFQEGPGILAKDFRSSGVPLIRIAGMHEKEVSLKGCNFLDEKMVQDKWDHFRLDIGDTLLSSSASLGKVSRVTEDSAGAIAYTGLIRFKTYCALSEDYMSLFFLSGEFIRQINNNKTGAAIKHFGPTHLKKMLVPMPPVKEQHRIVAKVDELMALCDQLEQQTEASIEAHQVLVTTLLDTLTNSADADELMQNWARISEHFDTLFTTEESIDQLKQTILQLAVMGKLVPQDPSDEPAAELLKRIAEEKAQLVKEKKIKKQKALPPISEDEKPFELPSGWEWERIGTFGIVGTGATPSRSNPKYWDDPKYNWVSSGETSELFVNTTKEKVSELAIQETNVSIYPSGTLIVAMYGQGKTRGQITELTEPAGTNQACAAIQLIEKNESHKDFVKLYFRKSYEELRSNAAGGAQPNLNIGKVQSTVIAVPPLNEQRRINTKVNELLTVCDHLKAHFEAVQSTQLHLTDAIVEQAV